MKTVTIEISGDDGLIDEAILAIAQSSGWNDQLVLNAEQYVVAVIKKAWWEQAKELIALKAAAVAKDQKKAEIDEIINA